MKTLSWGFIFLNLLFVLAGKINEGDSAELDYPRLKRNNSRHNYVKRSPASRTPVSQKPNLKISGRRISETKCREYIRERNQRANLPVDDGLVHIFGIGGRDALQGEFPHMVQSISCQYFPQETFNILLIIHSTIWVLSVGELQKATGVLNVEVVSSAINSL